MSAFDLSMMRIALRMARRGLGTTAPNPSVGAVIADETTGEIIARGWTQPGGRPHAETEALARAGDCARGRTMYVTLEPCSHHGKTPPCADAIVAAGLSRVVIGMEDPDPRVSGRGVQRLRDAGIEVVRSVLNADARDVTRGHVVRVTERRPFIQLKMALDEHGKVAKGADGKPVWVTGEIARAHGHLLRARSDAIVIGGGTLRDDNPELTCRLPGLTDDSPLRVVICGRDLPELNSRVVTTADVWPTLICAMPDFQPDRIGALEQAGCRIVFPTVVAGRLWLPSILEALVAEGVTRILIEGGPMLWQSFARAGLVDEVVQFRAMGGRSIKDVVGRAARDVAALVQNRSVQLTDHRVLGTDAMLVFSIG